MLLSTAVDTHSLEIVKLVIPTNTPTKESFLQDPITNHQLVGTVSYECVHIYYFLCKYNNNPSFAGNLDACLFQIQRLPPFFQHLRRCHAFFSNGKRHFRMSISTLLFNFLFSMFQN